MKYELIDITKLDVSFFEKIGKEWALLSASKNGKCNGMTVSWGGVGVLWNKNVFFCFVRPQRYTKEFIDSSDIVTLSFFDEDKRNALKLCGSKSGRDLDKFAEAELMPVIGDLGDVDFEESRLTLVGKKLYAQEMKPECFLDKEVDSTCYANKDYHTVYVCEITQARQK